MLKPTITEKKHLERNDLDGDFEKFPSDFNEEKDEITSLSSK